MTLPARSFGPADGVPLVALHGFLGSSADWSALPSLLPGTRVLAPDLPGHGEAAGLPEAAFPMEAAAHAVLETMDAHRTARAALLGYSMGGRLALFLALHAPERFSHLVLESASPGLQTEEARRARRHLDARRADALVRDLPGFLEAWYALPLFSRTPERDRRRLVRQRGQGSPEGLARSLRWMGTGAQPNLWPSLSSLRVPSVAIVGEHDAKFIGLARAMAHEAPSMQVEQVPGAGHIVHLDAPDAFARCVARALR